MDQVTFEVPAEYAETLRRAIVCEVKFGAEVLEDSIRDRIKAEEREDLRRIEIANRDIEANQVTLAEECAVVAQIPAAVLDDAGSVQLLGWARTFEGVAEEACGLVAGALFEESKTSPVNATEVSKLAREASWWAAAREGFEERRIEEFQARTEEGA